jgi:putative IMPACT (imprinted ancient) family translation regulator
LIRAYGEAASLALDAARVREVIPRTRLTLRFAYDDTSPAMHLLSQYDTVVAGTRYSDETEIDVDVRNRDLAPFQAAFVEALSGRGRIEPA